MSGETALDIMEKKAAQVFGGPQMLGGGMIDKSMLEMSDTNRLVFDKNQSQLQIGVKMLHTALVLADNRKTRFRAVKDSEGKYHNEAYIVDNWKWLLSDDFQVMANQLTVTGYSRSQHLKQIASMSPVNNTEGGDSLWARLTGRGGGE